MTATDPNSIRCDWCKAPVGEECRNTGSGPRERKTPHMVRVRAAQKADANRHVIVGEHQGEPVVLIQIVRKNRAYPGQYIAAFDCPWCGDEHVHGADELESRRPTRRVSHCQSAPTDYWVVSDPKAVA